MSSDTTDGTVNAVISAEIYTHRQWSCVPIPFRTKRPVIDGWQDLRLALDDLHHHFSGRSNVGVLLGEASNWLIDVDLDHALAVGLAPEFLPATDSIFGRKSKQRSHWLYSMTAPVQTKKEQAVIDGKPAMLVELRSSGCQTVFPPSLHPSGESITWAIDGDPAKVAPEVLLSAVTALASEVRKRLGVQDAAAEFKPRHVPIGPSRSATADDVERCRRYIAKLPPAISGSLGHHAAFRAACEMFRFGLSDSDALHLLQEYNARAVPPFSVRELDHKLHSARERVQGNGEFGSRLREQMEVWRLQKPGEHPAVWRARVQAIEHRLKQRRRTPA